MSSSKQAKFTESELQTLDTWHGLPEFGMQRSEPVEVGDAPTRTLTVDEIEAMQKQAYDEAFQQGQAAGFQQGHSEGFAEGEKRGYDAGFQQAYDENQQLLQQQAAELVRLLEALTEPFQKLDAAVESELVKLTIAIASQIIRREIKLDPEQILTVVRTAISLLPLAEQKVSLSLHPEDAELVKSVLKLDDSLPPWRILENQLITRGGCLVETDTSYIDATLENRLAAVIANVLGDERQSEKLS